MIKTNPPRVIAEVGCNHMGDMNIAHEMIQTAASFCKADVIKFQKRAPKELLPQPQYNAPHPVEHNSFGNTYGEHREFLEFDVDQHKQLKAWCDESNIEYCTSVWDLTSAREICTLEPKRIKIPSACNLNWEMLNFLCENFAGEIHLSVGMTSHHEEDQILTFFSERDRAKDLVIYSCTSGYPVAFNDICLREISRLIERCSGETNSIGFSGHHAGIAPDIAAMVLGAEWIERHFTLNRTWKGTDHAASLEPYGIRKLIRDLHNVHAAMQYKAHEILEVEAPQRIKLKRLD